MCCCVVFIIHGCCVVRCRVLSVCRVVCGVHSVSCVLVCCSKLRVAPIFQFRFSASAVCFFALLLSGNSHSATPLICSRAIRYSLLRLFVTRAIGYIASSLYFGFGLSTALLFRHSGSPSLALCHCPLSFLRVCSQLCRCLEALFPRLRVLSFSKSFLIKLVRACKKKKKQASKFDTRIRSAIANILGFAR